MPKMTKEEQDEEFKKNFETTPGVDGHSNATLSLLKLCSSPAVMNTTMWNEWRKNNLDINICLPDSDLQKAYLVGANLRDANLEGADFRGAHLEGVDFTGATLNGAKFKGAIFNEYTIFDGAKLKKTTWGEGVNLQGVSCKFAEFQEASLSFAHFEGANLYQAHFEKTILTGAHFESIINECYTKLFNAHFEGATLVCTTFNNNKLHAVHFEQIEKGKSTNIISAFFKNCDVASSTNFKNANMSNVNLKNTTIWGANLEGADLCYAILDGTNISGEKKKPNLKNTDFTGATVNGKTIIQECDIDEKTNFTMVGLDSARVEPKLLAALKTNIRRIAWNNYYKEQGKSLWGRIKTLPIRFFWWLSDYGSNTVRIFKTFLVVSLSFTLIYLAIAYLNPDPAVLSNLKITGNWWLNFMSAFCFAVSTMVTLGFGGINVTIQESAPWGTFFALFFVTFNLMIGYFILAVLVTRLGILFQSLAPEQKIKHQKDENTNKD